MWFRDLVKLFYECWETGFSRAHRMGAGFRRIAGFIRDRLERACGGLYVAAGSDGFRDPADLGVAEDDWTGADGVVPLGRQPDAAQSDFAGPPE